MKNLTKILVILVAFVCSAADYFPIAVGSAWNWELTFLSSTATTTRRVSTIIVADSMSEQGYHMFGIAKNAFDSTFDLIDSSFDYEKNYCEVGDSVFLCEVGGSGALIAFYLGEHSPAHADTIPILGKHGYLGLLIDVPDTAFVTYLGQFEYGDTLFDSCFSVRHTQSEYTVNDNCIDSLGLVIGCLPIERIGNSFSILAPGIGVLVTIRTRGVDTVATQMLLGYKTNGKEKWFKNIIGVEAPSRNIEEPFYIFPNPFNPKATIRFHPRGQADVQIYDLNGQLIRKWKSSQGFLVWDGQDLKGREVASGTYIVRLQLGEGVMTKRIVLTR